ncbi:hypothetical protein M9Y10_024111 [Tritrichomonas musculus]|uniref:Calcineurin-like phosphoesterase domain-containing protein n=1 Tax=Tritrichomonas musculus TaxID=1915356 RepID=A0ABR2KXU8_9EUKA
MNYRNDTFCETLEAIRKRLSDLRAVLDSGCYNQIEYEYHQISKQDHHSISQNNCTKHKKTHRHKKSRHNCYYYNPKIKFEERLSHKKRNTDLIGRPLYARAIPIEKNYLPNSVEVARLMKDCQKGNKDKKKISSKEALSKQKTPILFPYEDIKLKKEELSYDDSCEDYSEYECFDSEYEEDPDINAYAKRKAKNYRNKKEIVYLKTYQTKEKKDKFNDEPKIIQEKGKIIYFDPNGETDNDECNDDSATVKNPLMNENNFRNHGKKEHKFDPIVPIANDKNLYLKSKGEKLKKIEDKDQLGFGRTAHSKIDNIRNIEENDKIENKKNKKKQTHKEYIYSQKSSRTDSTPQNADNFQYIITQKKKIIKTSQLKNGQPIFNEVNNIDINATIKKYHKNGNKKRQKSHQINSKKYDINNFFTFKMCIDSQPICIAVGDIEGDIEKLYPIYKLIKANPSLNFVFIGDLIDDFSDAYPLVEKNWECLSLLSEFFVGKDSLSFKQDDDTNFKSSNISLPSAFNEIRFEKRNFDKIQGRVKFIAGNSECDTLSDIKKGYSIISEDVKKFVFGKNKWKKTISFERLCLLYRYFISCYGIIKLEKKQSKTSSRSRLFTDTIYFRHSPLMVNHQADIIDQTPDIIENDNEQGNYVFISGHIRKFVLGLAENPNAQAFIIDTSPRDYDNNNIDNENIQQNDKRLAIVSYDKDIGFNVQAFSLPNEFPKE